MTEDAPFLPGLSPVGGKPVHVAFDGGRMSSDAGVLLLASYARFWVTLPDQAARVSVSRASTPSVNVTPSMTRGNWFAPLRRRHVLAAA